MHTTTHNGVVSYHAERPAYTPPIICEQFVDDDGILQYILANGNTTPADKYAAMWQRPKGKINWRAKGINPNHAKLF